MDATHLCRRSWALVLIPGLLVGALVASGLARRSPYAFFDPLVEVHDLILRRFVDPPDEQAMQQGAIEGMISALGDPYTTYIPASDTREVAKQLTGDYVGIGVQVAVRDGWLTVVSPLDDSPAFHAGILADDRIVEIEGRSTFGLSADECMRLLTGEAGQPVSLVVERRGQRLRFTLVRQRVVARTVTGFRRAAGDAGGWEYVLDPARRIVCLRLTQFTPTTADDLRATLESLNAWHGGVGGLILDLRFNPGGVMQEAAHVADLFLSSGVIVSTRGRKGSGEIVRAREEGTLPPFPVAVLINGGSASASEVVAGALVDNGRAVAVGTRTFGKGLVQAVVSLPSGAGQLKITEQRYYLPSGRSLHRTDDATEWGVDPTDGFHVPMSDEQIAAMLEVRRRNDRPRPPEERRPEAWSDPAWIARERCDPQLAAALAAVQQRIDTGQWVPTGQPLPARQAFAAEELAHARRQRERLERELARLDERIRRLEPLAEPASIPDVPATGPREQRP